MPQGGELPQQKRRNQTNIQGPKAHSVYQPETGKTAVSPDTDAYAIDEGLADQPRPKNSVTRYDNPQITPSQRLVAGFPAPPKTSPYRRQSGVRSAGQQKPRTTVQYPMAEKTKRGSVHWLLPFGVGMLALLALWFTSSITITWLTQRYYDYRYGTPRTYQIDQVVGHKDSANRPSHFIAINLNRQAIVVEFPGGDPATSVSYVAPLYIAGDGADQAPITLEFRDVTGDGKPDMIMHIHLPNQDQLSVFVNDGQKFRPSNPNDRIRIE